MTPDFADPVARARWAGYFAEVDALLARAGDAAELRADLEAHAVERLAADPEGGELERVDRALARLGRPADYLRPPLARAPVERNTCAAVRTLVHATARGSRRALIAGAFGLGYFFLATFTAIAVVKPLWREHVGLFRYADGTLSAGIIARNDGARELLGWSSIPIALGLAALLYLVLARSRRLVPHRT